MAVILVISCGSGHQNEKETGIKRVYESGDSHSILYDTEKSRENILVTDTGSHYIILYQTSGNEWLIAEKSPVRPGKGRVETTHHLFYIPEKKQINIEKLHPALSSYGIWFEEKNGNNYLAAFLKGATETVCLPLAPLLKGELPEIIIPDQEKSADPDDPFDSFDPFAEPQYGAVKTNNEAVVLELMLGAEEHQAGEALVPFVTEDGLEVNSIISYTAHNGKLYIVESIWFRVLVYDYEGSFLRAVNYPGTLPGREGKINVLDIAADNEFLYLLSTGDNAVYIIDAETGDLAAIIEKGGPGSGQFSSIAGLTVDHQGYLRIHDQHHDGSGEIHIYRREGNNFKWIITEQYHQHGQMVPSPSGSIYEASVIDDTYSITRDDGHKVFRNRTPFGLVSASVMATDSEGNIYVYCEEVGGQIAGPYTLKMVDPAGKELYSLLTSFWDGRGPITRRVVVTKGGEVFDAYYDGDAFRDLEEEELKVTKLIVRRLK